MIANNINKNTSTKTPQREQKADFKTLKIPTDFLFPAFRTCERATLERRKGHSCSATVALSAFKCGSFASSESPNEKIGELFRQFEAGFPFWLEFFGGGVFVDILRHHPASLETPSHRFFPSQA